MWIFNKANGVFFWRTLRLVICLHDFLVLNIVDFKLCCHQKEFCFELSVLIL